jgi:hypothetical protein
MSLDGTPPWRLRRPPYRGRKGWTLIEEILQDVHDQAWCFLGDEGPGGPGHIDARKPAQDPAMARPSVKPRM